MEIFSKSPSVPANLMTPRPTLSVFSSVFLLLVVCAHASSPSPAEVNSCLGLELFSDESLWDDDAETVANRLDWPMESQTSTDSSFRKYPGAEEKILECRPFSTVLLAEAGSPSSLSLVFANKGDSVLPATANPDRKLRSQKADQIRDLPKLIRADKNQIASSLGSLFGEPVADRFGQGRETRENVKRWDWNGHAFLLASPRDEYVALRIMPTESADVGGKSRIPDSEIRARVASRIESRPNGDVILKDIPMVDQGPKGYCAPATWERVMRYMGVPADMYVLAMAGQTREGGGTMIADIAEGARESIVRSGRRIDTAKIKPDPVDVSRFIDRGLPLMWPMSSTPEYNDAVNSRAHQRREISTDSDEWKKTLSSARKAARKIKKYPEAAHICMIIGYNKKTDEIAVSDSWGPDFAERWITPEEAAAVSFGEFQVILF